MKKLTIILFEDVFEYEKYANAVCKKFSLLPAQSEFLGTWYIENNKGEAFASISIAVNHFIENIDKAEIIFGISSKDYEDVDNLIRRADTLHLRGNHIKCSHPIATAKNTDKIADCGARRRSHECNGTRQARNRTLLSFAKRPSASSLRSNFSYSAWSRPMPSS